MNKDKFILCFWLVIIAFFTGRIVRFMMLYLDFNGLTCNACNDYNDWKSSR
jgi:hypothetical protein